MTNMNKKRFAKKMKHKKLKDIRKSRPPPWSVPVPKHNLPSIGGKVRLYHYTPIENIGSIMTYGLIKGDVIADRLLINNWNAPILTSEKRFHNPANRNRHQMEMVCLRLEIDFDEKHKTSFHLSGLIGPTAGKYLHKFSRCVMRKETRMGI